MFGTRQDRTADELRRICREVDAQGDRLLSEPVLVVNKSTGKASAISKDYILGFMVAFFIVGKLVDDGAESFTGEDAAKFARVAYAETGE